MNDAREMGGEMSSSIVPTGARWLLPLAGLILAATYPLSWGGDWPAALTIAWKGSGVALLALWAAVEAKDMDGWLLAAVMAFGALGDVLLEIAFTMGALAFLASHLVAIGLYLRNRGDRSMARVSGFVWLLAPVVAGFAWALPADRAQAPGVALYAFVLGAMAAAALNSRFPWQRVGFGAILFVLSDLLIFARMGPLAGGTLARFGVWPLYYLGQLLIAGGVIGALRDRFR